MTFGGQADGDAARRMVDRCLDAGINFFDAANVYGPLSEAALAGCDAVWNKLRGITPRYNR